MHLGLCGSDQLQHLLMLSCDLLSENSKGLRYAVLLLLDLLAETGDELI